MACSIFELHVESDRSSDNQYLGFIRDCSTEEEAKEALPDLGKGYYYILPCYEVKDEEDE